MKKEIFILFLVNTCSAMGYSILAPIFPSISVDKGISDTLLGIIISIYPLFNFLVTLVCPYIFRNIGRKNSLVVCVILESGSSFLYGFLKYIDNYWLLLLSVTTLRIMHGTGAGITATLAYSLPSSICEEQHEKENSLGIMEVGWSLGVSIGPIIGSIFFHIGGYSLPFFVLGLLMSSCLYFIKTMQLKFDALCNINISNNDNNENEIPSIINITLMSQSIVGILAVVFYTYGNTFYLPSLAEHLNKHYGLTITISSLFFGVNMLFYFISLQLLNKFTDNYGLYGTCIFGFLFLFLGCPLVHPISIFPQTCFCTILGLSIIGMSGAPLNVPSIMILEKFLTEDLKLNSVIANDIASALYNFGINIGDFTGPILGGFFSDKFGFKYSCAFASLFNLIFGVFYFFYYIKEIKKEKKFLIFKDNGYVVNLIESSEKI